MLPDTRFIFASTRFLERIDLYEPFCHTLFIWAVKGSRLGMVPAPPHPHRQPCVWALALPEVAEESAEYEEEEVFIVNFLGPFGMENICLWTSKTGTVTFISCFQFSMFLFRNSIFGFIYYLLFSFYYYFWFIYYFWIFGFLPVMDVYVDYSNFLEFRISQVNGASLRCDFYVHHRRT